MSFDLVIKDCTQTEAQLLMTIYNIAKGNDLISDDLKILGYLADVLVDFFGDEIEDFVAYLPIDPRELVFTADKLDLFVQLIRQANALDDKQLKNIRQQVRERDAN